MFFLVRFSTYKFLSCYFKHFDQSEEKHDQTRISLASQHDWQFYFESWTDMREKVQLKIQVNPPQFCQESLG